MGQAASLGVGRGAVELYGVTLTGWLGWIARWGFFHWFMPSRRRAVATIRDWLTLGRTGRHLDDLEPCGPSEESSTLERPVGDECATRLTAA